MRQAEERRAAQRARVLHALHELGKGGQAAIDAAFHAAVEDEVGGLVGDRLFRELERSLLRRCGRGRRGGRRRAAGAAAAGTPVARRVEPEDGLLLFEQLNHRVQALLARALRDGDSSQQRDTHHDTRHLLAHRSSS